MTVLSPQWDFLYLKDILILNQGPGDNWAINPLTAGNACRNNQMLDSIVAADASALG